MVPFFCDIFLSYWFPLAYLSGLTLLSSLDLPRLLCHYLLNSSLIAFKLHCCITVSGFTIEMEAPRWLCEGDTQVCLLSYAHDKETIINCPGIPETQGHEWLAEK